MPGATKLCQYVLYIYIWLRTCFIKEALAQNLTHAPMRAEKYFDFLGKIALTHIQILTNVTYKFCLTEWIITECLIFRNKGWFLRNCLGCWANVWGMRFLNNFSFLFQQIFLAVKKNVKKFKMQNRYASQNLVKAIPWFFGHDYVATDFTPAPRSDLGRKFKSQDLVW